MDQLDFLLSIGHALATGLLFLAATITACMSLYLMVLAIASLGAGSVRSPRGVPTQRFAVLIPAHNEELLLGNLLQSLAELEYPTELFDVHVVADNCEDRTAEIAAVAGAHVHERHDPIARGKGHALNWLLDRLMAPESGHPCYDAFVVLDADSRVSPAFLGEMAAALSTGFRVLQGFNDIANPLESWTASLRYIAFCLICYLRRLGMSRLGLSVGLLGNGMCLSREVLARYRWDANSVTEDHELHFRLLAAGIKVAFVPEAHVYSQMPNSLGSAQSQNVRWERGKLELLSRYTPRMLFEGLRAHNWSMLAVAVEMSIPPFSLVFAATLLMLLCCVLLGAPVALLGLAFFSLFAQFAYVLRGLSAMPIKSPKLYLALAYAPLFIAWKTRLYVATAFGPRNTDWVRTARMEPNESI